MLRYKKRNLSYRRKKLIKNIEHLIEDMWEKNPTFIDLQYFQNINQIPSYSIDINGEGNLFAIGLPYVNNFTGLVKIYIINDDQSFTQLGSDLLGENVNDQFGFKIKLSNDGMTIAISSPYFDNSINIKGKVKVFNYNQDTFSWNQYGFDINDVYEDQNFGFNIDLSANGNILAIGAPFKNFNSDDGAINKFRNGQVLIFKFRNVSYDEWNNPEINIMKGNQTALDINNKYWIQMGNNILINYQQHNTFIGEYISLSKDGTKIALGIPYYDHVLDDVNKTIRVDDGKVIVFEYREINTQNDWDTLEIIKGSDSVFNSSAIKSYWVRYGDHFIGNNDQIGNGICLNYDGSILAFSSSKNNGYIKVFYYENFKWNQMGNIINNTDIQSDSYNIKLSDNGKVLAIGNGLEKGQINIYKFNDVVNEWNKIQNLVEDDNEEISYYSYNLGNFISLNSYGSKLISCSMNYLYQDIQNLSFSDRNCDSVIYNITTDNNISISGDLKLGNEIKVNTDSTLIQWCHVNNYFNCYNPDEISEILNENNENYKIKLLDYTNNNYLAVKLKFSDDTQKIKIINLTPLNFRPIVNIYTDLSFQYPNNNQLPLPLPLPLSSPLPLPLPLSSPLPLPLPLSSPLPLPSSTISPSFDKNIPLPIPTNDLLTANNLPAPVTNDINLQTDKVSTFNSLPTPVQDTNNLPTPFMKMPSYIPDVVSENKSLENSSDTVSNYNIQVHNDTKSFIEITYENNLILYSNIEKLKEIMCVEIISEIKRWCDIELNEIKTNNGNILIKLQSSFIYDKNTLKNNLLRNFSLNGIKLKNLSIY